MTPRATTMSVDWPFTLLGREFFDGKLPRLIHALERIADALEKQNKEKKHAPDGSRENKHEDLGR